ncbi:glycosyltransferase [Nisaea sp.]|uniref:glycosyltransferase n=1 Tax=Nisaea sp. TaxID=2024842 RepID=UPI0032974760
MKKPTDDTTLSRKNDELYDASYYENYNGESYGHTEHWTSFFNGIADNIVRSIQPKTVLEVGCAYGLLVAGLRDRGVDAFGMDVSQHAVSQGRPDIRKYLSEASILKPLDRHYDLIVTIEVIEHIQEEDCDLAIKNMCDAADSVLLATTPDGFDDPTHFNVNAPFYWIKKFSKFGFEPDVRHDAGYITPYAMLFRRKDSISLEDVHALFGEKKLLDLSFSRVTHEKNLLNRDFINKSNEVDSLKKEVSKQAATISDKKNHIKNLEATIDELRHENINLDHAYRSSTSWRITAPIRYGARLLQAFFPLFPKTIAEAKGETTVLLDSGKFTKWALIELGDTKNSDCHLALTADTRSGNQRLSLLRLSPHDRNVWLARAQRGARGHSLRVLRGAPSSINVLQISALSAWRTIILDRWQRGQGLTSALRFARNTVRSLTRRGLGATLNEFWPNASEPHQDYDDWVLRHDTPEQHKSIASWVADLDYQPLVSIILPTYNANLDWLSQAIASVTSQSYGNWELCIADDASTDSAVRLWLDSIEKDDRIKITFRPENGHISAASNSALALATGEFVTFLDHDDQLHPHALAAVVAQLNKAPDLDLVYTDEDKIDENGNRFSPNFKSDWNPDLLLSQNYICHLAVYRRALVEKVGGLREGYEGAQDYDLALRVSENTTRIAHIPNILYHWRAVSGSTALAAGEKDYAHERSKQVLADALERRSVDAEVLETGIGAYHRVRYALPGTPPRVTVIIPTRDQVQLMETCIGGLLNDTDYPDLEILIVDNDSQLSETRAFFDRVRSDTVRILDYPGAFNYAAINNFAAKQATGEVLVLLNNDIEVIHPDWLSELVSHALRPGIGAVGARLYYPDDHVQHDGIIVGMGGVAGYAHPRLERSASGAFGGSRIIRNYSAVTAAVLAIRKEIFEEVGGLDEINLAIAFNDVDFCLRIQEAGYRNLYTPFAELYHHESVSRGHDTTPEKAARFEREALYMKERWAALIENDPCYNPNLSLMRGFSLELERGNAWPWQQKKEG